MSSASLTPTSYVVLGLVALVGETTPYGLKRYVAESVGNFWSFPHSQLYSEPARLAAAGLLEGEQEDGGRRRRTYRITENGLAALRSWLGERAVEPREIRDPGLLKLFFGSLGEPEDVLGLARAQAEAHRRRLAAYEALEQQQERSYGSYPAATLRMGLRYEREAIEFWEEIAADPPADRPSPGRPPRLRVPAPRPPAKRG